MLNVGGGNPVQESPFLRVKGIVIFFTWVETRTRSTTQKTVGGPPRPPEPMSLLHQGEDNIRDKDGDNNGEDEAVDYKHN